MSKKRKNPLLSRDLSLIFNNFPEENVDALLNISRYTRKYVHNAFEIL